MMYPAFPEIVFGALALQETLNYHMIARIGNLTEELQTAEYTTCMLF